MLTEVLAENADCSVVCTDCALASCALTPALVCASDAVTAVASPPRSAGAAYPAFNVPDGPRPAVLAAGCATPAETSLPSAYCSTRSIIPVKPAGPPGGLGVNAEAPVGLPAIAVVPSRTSEGVASTAGSTWISLA